MILRMRDFLTCAVKDIDWLKRHTDSNTGDSLLVRVAATHAGILNSNNRFYRPDRMQASVNTWFPKGGFTRPVLIGHDEHGSAVGRVIEAKYVDESHKYSNEFPTLRDSIFYNRDSKKVGLYESIDWIVDNLMGIDDYTGLGYIELGLKVTDPEAIAKVLRDEYLTVSVGFQTDSGICSICHQDWAKDDKCEHRPGRTYDEKKAFLISGNFYYDEVSFVNFPADPFAGAISKKAITDSKEKIFFLGLSQNNRDKLVQAGLQVTDSIYESDIQVEVEMDPKTIDLNDVTLQESFLAEIKGSDLTAERSQEMKDQLQAWQPENDTDKTKKRSLVSTLNAQIKKRGFDKKQEVKTDDADLKELEAALDADGYKGCCNDTDGECEDWSKIDLTEEEKQYFSDEEGLYAELEAEMDAAKEAGEITDEQFKDAKLSSEQRKKLKGSTFCGPGRSFPVPDCAHVTAARRLIGRAKVSESTKSKILGCVSRKASSLGCGGKKDEIQISDTMKDFASQHFDIGKLQAGSAPAEIIAHYEGLHKEYHKADDDLKAKMRGLHGAILEHWHAGSVAEYYKQALAKHDSDSVLISKSELSDKEEAINSLSDEKTVLEKKISDAEETNKSLLKIYKKGLAQQIVMFRTIKGSDGYKDLTLEQRLAKVDELSKRHVEYLKDTVADIMSELKWDATSAPRTEKVEEPGQTVSDNAQVDELGVNQDTKTSDNTDPEVEKAERQRIIREQLMYMSPYERRIAMASFGYKEMTGSAKQKK